MNRASLQTWRGKKLVVGLAMLLFAALPARALAHCPLCSAATGLAAVVAASLGISTGPVGVFAGAFAFATGLWLAPLIRRVFIPHQTFVLAVLSFLATILPVLPLMGDYSSISIFLGGDYGSPLNRTYVINRFLAGSIFGAITLLATPAVSRMITRLRHNTTLPYQGVALTLIFLAIEAVALEQLL